MQGPVVVTANSAGIADVVGNPPAASSSVTLFFDAQAPTVELSRTTRALDTDWVFPLLLQFSEPVVGLSPSGFALTNGNITW